MTTDLANLTNTLEKAFEELEEVGYQDAPDENLRNTKFQTLDEVCWTCFDRIGEISNDPSIITRMEEVDRNEAMDALGRLTFLVTAIRSTLEHEPIRLVNLFMGMGALVERLGYDERLATEDHCVALFRAMEKILRLREQCLQEELPTEDVDECLERLSPPFMTYFRKQLPLLKELRDENEMAKQIFQTKQEGISMIRDFVLQAVEETILLAWVEDVTNDEDGSSESVITYAQRIQFTGLYSNSMLVKWATSSPGITGLDSKFSEAGNRMEMTSWTGLVDQKEHPVAPKDQNSQWKNPHRLFQEGIPDDIPTFQNEKIVLCSLGWISRDYHCEIFPRIDLEVVSTTVDGGSTQPLTDIELQELQLKLESAMNEEVQTALSHTLNRGGRDDVIRDAMLRFSMASMSMDLPPK